MSSGLRNRRMPVRLWSGGQHRPERLDTRFATGMSSGRGSRHMGRLKRWASSPPRRTKTATGQAHSMIDRITGSGVRLPMCRDQKGRNKGGSNGKRVRPDQSPGSGVQLERDCGTRDSVCHVRRSLVAVISVSYHFEDTPEQKADARKELDLWLMEGAQQHVADLAGVPVEDLDEYGGWPRRNIGVREESNENATDLRS